MNTPPAIIVPQTDPKANYLAHQVAMDTAMRRVAESGWYILGQEVAAFEAEFAHFIGAPHAIGVGNGTDALVLALQACGVGPGDLVFTVSHTAVATVAAIELAGARPILVDIDPVTFTLDPAQLAEAVVRYAPLGRPAAVLPVHLYGHPADLPAILEIAWEHGMAVVEDCAQAHGASLHGQPVGSWGDAAAFSFYPTKNLGALGDGGMVVTRHAEVAERVRLLRQYGWRDRYVSQIPGGNSRLDEMQAAILRAKLPHLEAENARRRQIAQLYDGYLAESGLGLPGCGPDVIHARHQYVVRSVRRDALQAHLRGQGIGSLVHYPQAVHQQPAYAGRVITHGDLPHSAAAAAQVLSLPLFPELSDAQVKRVAAGVTAALAAL